MRVSGTGRSYRELYEHFRELAGKYGNLPVENIISAYVRSSSDRVVSPFLTDPYIQNRRVKAISSLPVDYTKDKVVEMLRVPEESERGLREVSHALEWTAYPIRKIRKTYTDLMTYRYYTYPAFLGDADVDMDRLMREWTLVEKLNGEIGPAAQAHKITGLAIQEGKVFFTPRVSVDKSHNKVNAAMLEPLPSDWVKIVGLNSESGYTVAFNLFYLFQPGVCAEQYGDLLTPYLNDFNQILCPVGRRADRPECRVIYGTTAPQGKRGRRIGVDMEAYRRLAARGAPGNPECYMQNGAWAYWVTLPPERVWTFEIDDTTAAVTPIMTGLFLAMLQIAQYEQVQLELVQNPLISVMTGEIPYRKTEGPEQEDAYMLSEGGRTLFECYWYQMLAQNNTSGIGFFTAPVNNLKLHQLSEAPSATEISTKGYSYAVEKSGLAGLIPVNDNPRAGVVNMSAKLEGRFCQCIYWQFSRMMESIYRKIGFSFTWKFVMFGDITSDKEMMTEISKSMSSGILPDTFLYNALRGRSVLDDLAMSRVIQKSGIMDLRLPLVSGYSLSRKDPALPPKNQGQQTAQTGGDPGRPAADISQVQSEGTEDAIDAGTSGGE